MSPIIELQTELASMTIQMEQLSALMARMAENAERQSLTVSGLIQVVETLMQRIDQLN